MQTLLIADCNEDFRLALAEALQPYFRVLSCGNGNKALELASRERPEYLVLELLLPELDGVSLLEALQRQGLHPKVLVITALVTDYVFASAKQLGIQYVIRKPCPIRAALSRILDLSREAPSTPEVRLRRLLKDLGILEKHDGFAYMVEGILRLVENPGLSITKELYIGIAKHFRKQSRDVERSLRSALETGFLRGDPALWQNYFPGAQKRPSNGVFLQEMARRLREDTE